MSHVMGILKCKWLGHMDVIWSAANASPTSPEKNSS